jgi:hypothetical protein
MVAITNPIKVGHIWNAKVQPLHLLPCHKLNHEGFEEKTPAFWIMQPQVIGLIINE